MAKRQIDFNTKGYCIVRSALDEELINFISQYTLFDEKINFTPGTEQVIGAHEKYADPAMEVLLLKLLPLMEEATNLRLYPTYSFYRVYRSGDELSVHKDRPSCEISATLCFNYSYTDYEWPIYMEDNPIILNPGDMVIYRGCDLYHSRPKLNTKDDSYHIQGFFHYVDADGQYSNYKYDGRSEIGISKNYKSYITHTGRRS